jgi:hypothetical protein
VSHDDSNSRSIRFGTLREKEIFFQSLITHHATTVFYIFVLSDSLLQRAKGESRLCGAQPTNAAYTFARRAHKQLRQVLLYCYGKLSSCLSSCLLTIFLAIVALVDIETIDALCDAINEFNGGIVVVTHDQRLIEECECTLWVVEKQGVTEWKEGFDDYKETILRQLEEEVEREAQARKIKIEAAAAAKAEKLARLAKKVKRRVSE